MKNKLDDFKEAYHVALNHIDDDNVDDLLFDYKQNLMNKIKAHSFFVLSILVEILSLFVVFVVVHSIEFLLFRFFPNFFQKMMKIMNFLDLGICTGLLTVIYNEYDQYSMKKSTQLCPSRKGHRFIVYALINILLCLFFLYSVYKYHFIPDRFLFFILLEMIVSVSVYSYYMLSYYKDCRNNSVVISHYTFNENTNNEKTKCFDFEHICYINVDLHSMYTVKDGQKKLNTMALQNYLDSYVERVRIINKESLQDHLCIIPCIRENNKMRYTNVILLNSHHVKDGYFMLYYDKNQYISFHDFPNMKELSLMWRTHDK